MSSVALTPGPDSGSAVQYLLQGIALDAYTTLVSADDIEDLRRALGYDQFDLVGLSYGTQLALVTAERHPHGIRSLVLAGVAPPGAPLVLPMLEVVRVVTDLGDVCIEQPDCDATYGDLDALLVAAMNRATRDGGSERASALSEALFYEAYWVEGLVRLPKVLAAAAEGDWDEVGALLPSFGALLDAAAPANLGGLEDRESFGLFQSVSCSERFAGVEDPIYAPIRARLAAAGASRAYLDRLDQYRGPSDAPPIDVFCGLWGVAPQPDVVREAVSSDVPTLLVSGRFDPTTPPRHAEGAAETLTRSHVVVADHLAHGLILVDRCVDRIVAEFLEQPDRRPSTACLADAPPPRIELH